MNNLHTHTTKAYNQPVEPYLVPNMEPKPMPKGALVVRNTPTPNAPNDEAFDQWVNESAHGSVPIDDVFASARLGTCPTCGSSNYEETL